MGSFVKHPQPPEAVPRTVALAAGLAPAALPQCEGGWDSQSQPLWGAYCTQAPGRRWTCTRSPARLLSPTTLLGNEDWHGEAVASVPCVHFQRGMKPGSHQEVCAQSPVWPRGPSLSAMRITEMAAAGIASLLSTYYVQGPFTVVCLAPPTLW